MDPKDKCIPKHNMNIFTCIFIHIFVIVGLFEGMGEDRRITMKAAE
jgi:hypothetical protein